MLPKPLYESLPYLYLLAGIGVILLLGGIASPAGIMLYFIGAWVWVMRSEQRRRSSRERRYNLHKFYWNPVVYELLPFLYILAGLLLIDLFDHRIRFLSGGLLIMLGACLLLVRSQERQRTHRPIAREKARLIKTESVTEPRLAGALVPEVKVSPGGPLCRRCVVLDVCQTINLQDESIREIMRLNQTVSHDQAYPLFHQAVERTEGRRLSDTELRPVLDRLAGYANLCATWRNRGRHAS